MQIVEQTGFGLRSAVMTLAAKDSDIRFQLFPMIHLGSPAFYQHVHKQLMLCDVVVVEGVQGRRAALMTLSYRIAGRVRREALVDQGRGLVLSDLPGQIVRPDLSAEEFGHGWAGVPLWVRLLIYAAAPFVGLWMIVVGPKRFLRRGPMNLDDLPTREEQERADQSEAFDAALLDARDVRLCQTLLDLSDGRGAPQLVGVCWGAGHMRAVLRTLMTQRGYRVQQSTWLTVVNFID